MTTSLSDLARQRDELERQRTRQQRSGVRAMKAMRIFNGCILAYNAVWFGINVAAGRWIAVISAMCVLAMAFMMVWQTVKIRQREEQLRPRPDYSAIARMERDVWGEAFEHAGAPQRFPIASPRDLAAAKRLLGPAPPGVTMAEFAEGVGRFSEFYRRTICAKGHPARPEANGMCPKCEMERRRMEWR